MIQLKKIVSYQNHTLSILLIVMTLLLSACVNKDPQKSKTSAKPNKSKTPTTEQRTEWKLPVSPPEGEFYKFAGWISDTEVLYITNVEQTSNVYLYHLLTGKSALIYKSKYPIVTVEISPSKNYILIHSSPSSYEGLVTIIDAKGSQKLNESFPSHELEFEWNPYNESQVLVTKFAEDWTFSVSLLDIENSKSKELSVPQPFIKWMNEEEIAFLNWDENNPALFAPLIGMNLDNESEKPIFPSAIHFSTFRHLIMTVTVSKQDQSKAAYSFYDQSKNEIFSFSIPQLTNFSDWLVPFYDYDENKGQFITLQPLSSGEFDSYRSGFQLVLYDVKKGSKKVIMEGLENEPITISPSGDALLFGNSLENIIDLKAKKKYMMIKE
ncbi:hypothetical protein [Neobacillus bataviensis]|uniref:YqgU-like beta propeller domain-containing protein n=1 Tax=Neobacillus bataviensis TaxID=220685 RepID=UPI001CC0D0F2|nr:hypothetical protein [Neobacillus bataviensis]